MCIVCWIQLLIPMQTQKTFTSKPSCFIPECCSTFNRCFCFCIHGDRFCINFCDTNLFCLPCHGGQRWSPGSGRSRCCGVWGWSQVGIAADRKLCFGCLSVRHRVECGNDFWNAGVNPGVCPEKDKGREKKLGIRTSPGLSLQWELRSHQDSNLISIPFLRILQHQLPLKVHKALSEPTLSTSWD